MSSDEDNNPKEDTEHSEHKRTSNDRTSHNTNNKSRKSMKKKKNKPKKTLTKHKTNKSKGKRKGTKKKDLVCSVIIPAGDDGRFHCTKCSKSYGQSGHLYQHIRYCHEQYAKTLFPVLCKIHKCSMRFGSPMAADKHLDAKHPLYAGNNKYRHNPIAITCTVCKKRFSQIQSYLIHNKTNKKCQASLLTLEDIWLKGIKDKSSCPE
eukprot:42330_1